MMYLAFIFNIPFTVVGLIGALLSVPQGITIHRAPLAFALSVKSFWWYQWLLPGTWIRGMAFGHVVMLNPDADDKDLAHELIHVEQFTRFPIIQPLLNLWEMTRRGTGMDNKYEREAYERSGSRFGYYRQSGTPREPREADV